MIGWRFTASKITASIASVAFVLTSFGVSATANAVEESTQSAVHKDHGVIVTAFQQNWKSIARECEQTYGPEGVKYVQVSPAQDHIKGKAWWTSYQPVSYNLNSKLGTEAEFKNMITTCKAQGVGIIVDAVINHMTGFDNKDTQGVGGSEYNASEQRFTTAGYTKDDFHQDSRNIDNYKDAQNVWNRRLVGLLDLDTSKPHVQQTIGKYFADLLKLGVAGFRVDAVKHISPSDILAIKQQAASQSGKDINDIWWMQETIGNPSEASELQPDKYLKSGQVNEFAYAYRLHDRFRSSLMKADKPLNKIQEGLISDSQAAIFVTNWDTERGNQVLTYKDNQRYSLANAFMLAYPYGTPNIFSGYRFSEHDEGAPGATDSAVGDVACGKDSLWQCTQRWTAIRGMIGFHNAVQSEPLSSWQDDGDNNVAFDRGNKGFFAINNDIKSKEVTYKTSLADGEYCNVYAAGDCSKTVQVKDGKLTTTIEPRQAVALHVNATKQHHSSGQASDPSDPSWPAPKEDEVAPFDKTLTVYFHPDKNFSDGSVYNIHYQKQDGQWTNVPGEPMERACDGWWKKTIQTNGKKFELVFNDGKNNWYNNTGTPNFTAPATAQGQHYYSVENRKGSSENSSPCVVKYAPKTHVKIHYKPSTDTNPDRGVWLWGKNKDGKKIEGKWHPFNGNDAYGKVYEATLDDAFGANELKFLITTENWNKIGGDRGIETANTGLAEAWVDGANPDITSTSAPESDLKKPKELTVTIHYHNNSGDYAGWNLWTWLPGRDGVQRDFTSHDEYGLVAKYTVKNDHGITQLGFKLRRTKNGDPWGEQDPGDRAIANHLITMNADGKSGSVEVWVMNNDMTVYANPSIPQLNAHITSSDIIGFDKLSVGISKSDNLTQDQITLEDITTDANEKLAITSLAKSQDGTRTIITTSKPLNIKHRYKVSINKIGSAIVSASSKTGASIVRTAEFDKQYAYAGDDLGAVHTPDKTVFKLWAPTATKVELVTYKSTEEKAEEDQTIAMNEQEHGVWNVVLDGDHAGMSYTYKVHFADGTVQQSADPYARAAVVNGKRSVVLADKDAGNAGDRMSKFTKPTDATIAEMDIRDFSINPNSGISKDKQGKYLGVIEEGTKTTDKQAISGFDYLKSLGISHVQIMPMYDYGSVNETGDLSYKAKGAQNWGYDPENYNVPEGSYSSDPKNPTTRVQELKTMIKGLHKAGIRVIMDVVYNHVYNAAEHSFNKTVPGYYFRYKDGALNNNSGCGNDTASERQMMRKYIVDSVTYWAKHYNLDGFRFDLMGLIDLETMKQVRSALNAIDPSIIVLGEGWDMNSLLKKSDTTIQPNAHHVPGIAFFNDSFRDAMKGSVFNEKDTGFISGKEKTEPLIAHNILGCQVGKGGETKCWNGNAEMNFADAGQVVQYVEAHDNLTLYDKLKKSVPNDNDQTIEKRVKLANSMIMLSRGLPFIQLGQEFLRTKNANGNSYNAGDEDNAIDWNRSETYKDSVQYLKGLLNIRKNIAALRDAKYELINKHTTVLKNMPAGVVAYELTDGGSRQTRSVETPKRRVVIFNANDKPVDVKIPEGTYVTLIADGKVYNNNYPEATLGSDGTYRASAISATMLELKDNQSDSGEHSELNDNDSLTPKYPSDKKGKPGETVDLGILTFVDKTGKKVDLPAGAVFESESLNLTVDKNTGSVKFVIPKDAKPGEQVTAKLKVTYPNGVMKLFTLMLTVDNSAGDGSNTGAQDESNTGDGSNAGTQDESNTGTQDESNTGDGSNAGTQDESNTGSKTSKHNGNTDTKRHSTIRSHGISQLSQTGVLLPFAIIACIVMLVVLTFGVYLVRKLWA